MPDDVAVCLECGAELPVSRASGNNKGESSAQTQPNPEQIIKYQTVYVQQPAKAAPDAMGKAVTSLVIGLVGLFGVHGGVPPIKVKRR